MKEILKEISESTLLMGDFEFSEEQKANKWLGYLPASDIEIERTEKRLKNVLPEDYKQFLRITNGFPQYNNIVPSFFQLIR